MGRFFGGFFTGFITVILIIGITLGVLLMGVPLSTFGGWFGLDITEDNPNRDKSVVEVGQVAIDMITNLDTKSLNDIKKNFGFDVLAKVKETLGVPAGNTAFDGLASCQINQITTEMQNIKTGDLLAAGNVTFDDNLKEMITPMLNSTLKKMTNESSVVINDLLNNIKIRNINVIDPELLPKMPIFTDDVERGLVDIVKNIENLSIENIILVDEASPKIIKSLKGVAFKNISKKFETITIGEVIDVKADSPQILQTLKDEAVTNLGERFKTLTLKEVITINESSPEAVKSLKDTKITELDKNLHSIKVGELIKVDASSPQILKSLKDTPISELSNKVNTLQLKDIILIDATAPLILQSLQTSTLNSLPADVNAITIGQVVPMKNDGTDPQILVTLKDTKINELSDKIKTLTVDQIIDIPADAPKLMQSIKGMNFNNLATEVKALKVNQVFDVPAGSLIEKMGLAETNFMDLGANVDLKVKKLKISDIITPGENTLLNELVTKYPNSTIETIDKDMQSVVGTATLGQLKTWGILPANTELNKSVGGGKTLADFTISELITYINNLTTT